MQRRKPAGRARKRNFGAHAVRTHKFNLPHLSIMRGGIRL